jgi:hypothetical protein
MSSDRGIHETENELLDLGEHIVVLFGLDVNERLEVRVRDVGVEAEKGHI